MQMLWVKIKASWGWRHKMKILGSAAMGVSYAQANISQLAAILSANHLGAIMGVFGVLAFVIGLCNTFVSPDPP
jgi:hypothetical protein